MKKNKLLVYIIGIMTIVAFSCIFLLLSKDRCNEASNESSINKCLEKKSLKEQIYYIKEKKEFIIGDNEDLIFNIYLTYSSNSENFWKNNNITKEEYEIIINKIVKNCAYKYNTMCLYTYVITSKSSVDIDLINKYIETNKNIMTQENDANYNKKMYYLYIKEIGERNR